MLGGGPWSVLLLFALAATQARQVAPELLPVLQRATDEPTAAVAALLSTEDGILALHTLTEGTNGDTPLHVAATRGWSQVTRLLVEAGADIEHTNAQYATPLVAAAQQPPSLAQLGVVSALLDSGADVNARPSAGHSALHICARDGNDDLCTTLLSAAGVEPNIQTAREIHRTLYAPCRLSIQSACCCVAEGQTPLHLAATNGHTTTCHLLLQSGANPTLTNNFGLPSWANAPAAVAEMLRDAATREL